MPSSGEAKAAQSKPGQVASANRPRQPRPASVPKTLTPHQLANLKSGSRVNIFIGPPGDQFIGVEAYANILKHFCSNVKDKLSISGANQISIPYGKKPVISWIYKFMLSGEKDPEGASFDDFYVDDLLDLYTTADVLGYKFMANKVSARMRYLIQNEGCPDADTMKACLKAIPSLSDVIAQAIAFEITDWVVEFDWTYIEEAYKIEGLGPLIEKELKNRLDHLIARSVWYYGQPQVQRRLQHQNRQYYYRNADVVINSNANDKRPKNTSRPGRPMVANPSAPGDKASANVQHVNGVQAVGSAVATQTSVPDGKNKNRRERKKTVRSDSEVVDGKVADSVLDKSHPAGQSGTGRIKPRNACYTCGERGHYARDCTAEPATGTAATSGPPQPKASGPDQLVVAIQEVAKSAPRLDTSKRAPRAAPTCYNCHKVGHIARNCDVPRDVQTDRGTRQQSDRAPPTCYNCNNVGHIARNCTVPRNPDNGAHRPNGGVKENAIVFVGADKNMGARAKPGSPAKTTNEVPLGGRNKSHRRVNEGKWSDELAQVASNGEDITTCNHEVKPGAVTRTGLVV